MLIRQYSNPEETVRPDRQALPCRSVSDQWVRIDSWEDDDCVELIAAACGIAVEGFNLESWNPMPTCLLSLFSDHQIIPVSEDQETGFVYLRRTVDIARAKKCYYDHTFRITASEWEPV